jgi:hypothetical protein
MPSGRKTLPPACAAALIVRYSRLKIPQRTEIEFFAGGHEMQGLDAFRFLQQHLNWPK